MRTFLLPDLGEGLTESDVVAWRVAEGDTVALNQPLADIETAKAVVELPSPYAGVVRRLHAAEGETVAVGAPLIDFEVAGEERVADEDAPSPDAGPVDADAAAHDAAKAGPERVQVLVGSIAVHGGRASRSPRTWDVEPFVREQRGPNRATPPVRKLAKDRGIDLQAVRPSGDDGLVTRADLAHHAAAAAAPASTRERITGLRKHTAAAMTASLAVPQAATFHRVDVTDALALAEESGTSFLALASRAVVLAAKRWPDAVASFHADSGEVERFAHVHLGIAVSTDRGLVVASIDEADRMTATELADAIRDRARRARDGSLSMAELTSSNLTISNVGVFGVDGGIPIVNPGESAIVALGAIRAMPWAHEGGIALRDVCTVTVSFDHRVLDGREAAGFLADIAAVLERPALALVR